MVQRQLADMPVRLDGRRVVKPSTEVRVGQVLVLPFHGRVEVFEILSLPERRGPVAEAKSHVRAISRTFGQLTGTGADA
ncbi:RNA-binding S4 domain-containing protein [Sphingomicrobium nitratireducens]|uniref:RNA-binding S4 domain-containing protein n=1 Tax=Sphingomicrobium nitratireducens TaxID=2964666 RepID=UPI003B847508